MKYILNDKGEPMPCEDIMTWANWFETSDRRVAVDAVDGEGDVPGEATYLVSTVFLGINYNCFDGPPLLWETMVFKGREGLWFDRCGGSREQAEAMHNNMCKKISDKARHLNSRVVHGV